MIKKAAHVHDQENGSFVMETPYHERFVQEFKDITSPQDRDWDGERKRWTVDSDCFLDVLHLMSHYFEPIVIHDASGAVRYRVSTRGVEDV